MTTFRMLPTPVYAAFFSQGVYDDRVDWTESVHRTRAGAEAKVRAVIRQGKREFFQRNYRTQAMRDAEYAVNVKLGYIEYIYDPEDRTDPTKNFSRIAEPAKMSLAYLNARWEDSYEFIRGEVTEYELED